MIRCPECGVRVSDEAPVCAEHGAVPRSSFHSVPAPPHDPAFAALGYRVIELIGRGGFGVVYAAERVADAAPVAIKLALRDRPDAIESLRREDAALRAVGPPHAPAIYESGPLPDSYYVVMERIAAPTLADRMVELAGPAALETFSALAHAILTPLEAIHAAGLVHGDLKPENIFIYDTGAARVIDFGLARTAAGTSENLEATADAADVGTAEYMSPEQCDGQSDLDPRSDIYSAGVLFYELLTGAPPFWGGSADVREAHRSRRPAPLSLQVACPTELDLLVRRCLAKDRARRFDNVALLRRALERALAPRPVSRLPKPMPTTRSRQPPSAAAPQPSAAREKRAMGLVFFESRSGLGSVQSVVTASGGQIVQTNGSQYVAAFGHDIGDNPARAAMIAAHRLIAAKLSLRLLVDVVTVSTQTRPDGSRRIFSSVLSKTDRFPTEADPAGVMFTGAASEVLPDLQASPIAQRRDRYTLASQQNANEVTSFDVQLSPLVGREQTLATLTESAQRATPARPTLITVLGANGYGRTHLAAVAAVELAHSPHRFDVIRLTAQEGVVSATSRVLPELLRRVLDVPFDPPPAEGRALLLERLGDAGDGVWAAAAHALGWIEAEHPEVRRLAAAPGALRLASARAAGEALRRRARKRPLALLLDDAHLADDATLDALEYATLKELPSPIWICVLARPHFAGSRPSWGSRAAAALQIVLRELAQKDAVELARRLLLPAEYIPQAVLQQFAERTQGVPRLLVELVRGLKRDGFVRRASRGSGYYLAIDELAKLPDLPIVQWNASREIEALPAQLAGHARLSSVLGANFSILELEAVLQVLEREALPEDMQLDASVGVQRLVDSGILVRLRTGRVAFRHALLRDTLYGMLPEAQRASLHRAAYDAYRALALPDEQRLPRLALHAARSGKREVAARTYLELAERAGRVQAYLEAEAAFGSALENLAEDDERTILAGRGRGLMRSRLARHESALDDLRRARERAHARGATEREIELMLDEATVLDWTRETSQSAALVRGVEAMDVPLSPLLRARLLMGAARSHHRQGEAEATVRVGAEAAKLAEALGDEGYETRIVAQLMVATDCANSGRLEEAESGFEQVIADAQSRGDLWHVAAALGNRAVLWHGRRDLERLFADLLRLAQLGRELGEPSVEFVATYNLAESEYVLARLPPAREHARRGLELSKQLFGDANREVSVSELLLARIALYDGDLAAAREHTSNIRERTAQGLAAGAHEIELEPGLQLLLEMVELGVREASLADWQALCAQGRARELQPMEEVELLERAALAAAQLGDMRLAESLYREAQQVSLLKPNLMSERVEQKLSPLFAARSM